MHPAAKWIDLEDGTRVKRVPGGMVLQAGMPGDRAMVFVPCPGELFVAFLEGNGVNMSSLEPAVMPPRPGPRIVTP